MRREAKTPLDRVALVTGAAKNIGREIALRLANQVSAVAVHYHQDRASALNAVGKIRRAGKGSAAFPGDLTREHEALSLIEKVERRFGSVDILVNVVGPILIKPWTELRRRDWDHVLSSNLLSAFFCLRAALPGMRAKRWGRIINLGYHRVEQLRSFPNIAPYSVAKTGLLILTRTVAVSEAPFGITVNMVSPGLLEDGTLPRNLTAPRGLGTSRDVAEAVAFLASDAAQSITGVNLIVAGTWKM